MIIGSKYRNGVQFGVEITKKHSFYRRYGKRCFDFLLALVSIIVLSPVLLVLTLLVRIKHGTPVLFSPTRPGMFERVFPIYKFRTMSNARDDKGRLLPDKNRITRLGNVMRKTSLDELPELFNILKGDMSFVGPRPLAKNQLPGYREAYRTRFLVRPGLTGLAQINGRNGLDWDLRFKYDVEYVENMSFFYDIKIIIDTFLKVIRAADVTVPGTGDLLPLNMHERMRLEGTVHPIRKDGFRDEIGGDFWIEKIDDNLHVEPTLLGAINRNWKTQDSTLTFAGRASIELALVDILNDRHIKRACVPAYCSFGMLQPFMERKIPYDFYDVSWNGKELCYQLNEDKHYDLALTMTYFGMSSAETDRLIQNVHEHGGVVIEDITHALFDKKERMEKADYYVASLRKWFPLYSGGWLGKVNGTIEKKPNISGDAKVDTAKLSMELMADYIEGRSDDKATCILNRTYFEDWLVLLECMTAIDSASEGMLARLDFEKCLQKRKNNAMRLYDGLCHIPGIQFLNKRTDWEMCAPICVPVLIEHDQRNALQETLAENGIYCQIMWQERMGADMSIRDRELSLVCDHRYNEADMDKMIGVISDFFIR